MSCLFLVLFSVAQAGYLRIAGNSDIHLKKQGPTLVLSGTYTMTNQGNEEAKKVWPELSLDQYTWKGFPQDLAPGESYTWEFQKKLTKGDLCLQASAKCPQALPSKGQFLIRGHRHYQDRNGYLFVIPDVLTAALLSKTGKNLLDMQLKLKAIEKREYRAEVELVNQSEEDLKARVSWLLPYEMDQKTEAFFLEVPALGAASGRFLFRNRSGLPGSDYLAIGIAEWVENGERRVVFRSGLFKIENPPSAISFLKNDRSVLMWTLWSVSVGLILMWIFWSRPLRKSPRLFK